MQIYFHPPATRVRRNATAVLLEDGCLLADRLTASALQGLMKVRNCIAHVGGRVDTSGQRQRLEYLAKNAPGLSISSYERLGESLLVVDSSYCEEIVKDVSRFFQIIFSEIGYGETTGKPAA